MEPTDDFFLQYEEEYTSEEKELLAKIETCRKYIDDGQLYSNFEYIEETVTECTEFGFF